MSDSRRKIATAPFFAVLATSLAVAVSMAFGLMTQPLFTTADQQDGSSGGDVSPEVVLSFEEKVADLEEIGSYQAVSQMDDADRAVNLALAAEAINELEIHPGETVSTNEILGDTTEERGYRLAPVYADGGISADYGGGVCQVSTAFYIASLEAGLEVVERHAHSIACDYAPIGLDATLAYGLKDLKIKNGYDHSVFVKAHALGQTVDVAIYGEQGDSNVAYDAISRISDTYTLPADEVLDDPDAVGVASDDDLTFYEVESYRAKYVDGVVQENEPLDVDTYRAPAGTEVRVSEGLVGADK